MGDRIPGAPGADAPDAPILPVAELDSIRRPSAAPGCSRVAPPKEAPIGQLDAGAPRHDDHDHPTTGRGSHEHAIARPTARSRATTSR